ncbi:MAG: hypothetical protein K8J08_09730, partial [Thermoanaerobaculia bacterium]|nr:hypothetical protein [Thermoanaerobaculia bacterium]
MNAHQITTWTPPCGAEIRANCVGRRYLLSRQTSRPARARLLGALAAGTLCLLPFLSSPAAARPGGDLGITTYPIGLVTGELPVEVDLGASGAPATLYLDGTRVCEMTADHRSCTVDLGPDPHLHLLDLVRPASSGGDVERAFRWVNRPGQEAELLLRVSPPDDQGRCRLSIITNHPLKQRPAVLEVRVDNELQPLEPDGTADFPCVDDGESRIAVASAIFPDGRRVEDVQLLGGGFMGQVESELEALPVLADDSDTFCELAEWPEGVVRAEPEAGYEVVIVLDPKVPYERILETGWFGGDDGSSTGLGDVGSDIIGVQQRSRAPSNEMHTNKESGAIATWSLAEVNLQTADRLWYVAPAGTLPRVDGFAAGRKNWLKLLFKFGMGEFPGNPRLADAVASSGLVAAAEGERRVVILLLSNRSEDESELTPKQAMDYLAEVGVPLVVFRSGRPKGDGWPDGVKNSNMASMAKNLQDVSDVLDRQCVV